MLVLLVGVIFIGYCIYKSISIIVFSSELDEDNGYAESWYGKDPKDGNKQDVSVRSFKIEIPDDVLKDLKSRLERTRFEEPLIDSKFLYGFNPDYLKTLVEYWKKDYDWSKQENELNKYPHFKTSIEGIDVHFMHVKPVLPEGSQLKVIPLLLLHGWPGSFAEFLKVVPLFTTPRQDCSFVFEIIVPSIPGYGFSEAPHRKGFNARAAARIFITLMERLGHSKFYVQGGDWGSIISSIMARYYPSRTLGLHVNMYGFQLQGWDRLKFLLVLLFPFLVSKVEYETYFPLKKTFRNKLQEMGYFYIQSTKPNTIGCGMSDSPAGMAAYLLEKFSVCQDREYLKLPDGGLTKKFTMDELLTNVMIYWVNNNFTSAARFYKENLGDILKQKHEKIPVTVPSGVALFPKEVIMMPRMLMSQQMKNIVSYNVMPRGGHFAALEEPQLFSDDVWQFVGIVEKQLNKI